VVADVLSALQCSSQDGAEQSHLEGGNAAAVQQEDPVTVRAAQYPCVLRQGRDGVLKHLVCGADAGSS
jgi:hypothetical protein